MEHNDTEEIAASSAMARNDKKRCAHNYLDPGDTAPMDDKGELRARDDRETRRILAFSAHPAAARHPSIEGNWVWCFLLSRGSIATVAIQS